MCLFRKASQSHHIQRAENTTGPAIASAIAIRLKMECNGESPREYPAQEAKNDGDNCHLRCCILEGLHALLSRGLTSQSDHSSRALHKATVHFLSSSLGDLGPLYTDRKPTGRTRPFQDSENGL